MAHIVLWNSIAKRRRSISDTFYDNGLATLKGYLEEKGHYIEIIDWARDDFFQSLGPRFLSRWLRGMYSTLMAMEKPLPRKTLGFLTLQLQGILSMYQTRRLRKRLKNLAQDIKQRGIRIVGVKIWYGEAFSNAKYLIEQIAKVSPSTITIAGGYHVTLYEEHILANSLFDLGVACEGEFALEKILNTIDENILQWDKQKVLSRITTSAEEGSIENLIYRKDGAIHKTKRRQLTVHSSKSIPHYLNDPNKVKVHVMVESLGCDWGRCNFCVHSQFYSRYSLRDPEEIIQEIQAMRKAGIGVFRFAGSDTPPNFGAQIARKILEKKVSIIFGMGSRAIKGAAQQYEHLVEAYTTLIKAGLRAVFMGGETGNDLINQEVMNKGVGFEDIVNTIKALREAEKKAGEKVFLSLAFIYPAPLLGKATLKQVKDDNIRLLKETMPDSVMITPPGPFLHTLWYDEREKFGFTVDDNIIQQAMEYEYVLYKPPSLWPKLGVALEGRPFVKLLDECNDLRKAVEKELHIPTDISDEHFLMFYSAGVRTKEEIFKAKNDTMLDIVSCDYTLTQSLARRVNEFSEKLSRESP